MGSGKLEVKQMYARGREQGLVIKRALAYHTAFLTRKREEGRGKSYLAGG